MAAHTPGPWTAFDDEIVGRADEHVADVPLHDGTNPTEWQANMRLIAAAPELLAALRLAVEAVRAFHGIGFPARGSAEEMAWALYQASPEMQQINAAIAKAEGR